MTPANYDKDHCEQKHRFVNRFLTLMLSAMGLLIVVTGWAVAAGYGAQAAVTAVNTELQVHTAEQKGEQEKLAERLTLSLARIEDMIGDVKEDQKEQKKLIESLLRSPPDHSP